VNLSNFYSDFKQLVRNGHEGGLFGERLKLKPYGKFALHLHCKFNLTRPLLTQVDDTLKSVQRHINLSFLPRVLDSGASDISPRQLEILSLLKSRGSDTSSQQIAQSLNVSSTTAAIEFSRKYRSFPEKRVSDF
jgi:ATP/maltotriose-dependent transcriptional regulator MalT